MELQPAETDDADIEIILQPEDQLPPGLDTKVIFECPQCRYRMKIERAELQRQI